MVATHCLAAAATNVLADVCEDKYQVSWRTRARDDSGLSQGQVKGIMNEAWSFFKHAERDANSVLEFNESETEGLLFMAVLDCGDLHETSPAMQAFQLWYIAAHPGVFPEDEPPFSEAIALFPNLATLPRDEKIKAGALFFTKHCLP